MLDELDLTIVSALQVHPRVSWAQLSTVINMDPTTLSRRWARIREDRVVWMSVFIEPTAVKPRMHRGREVIALVELHCAAGRRDEVVTELSGWYEVMSIDCVSGEWDLMLTLGILTVEEIDDLVTRRIGVLPGVVATRMHFVHTLYRQGSDWRANKTTEEQARRLTLLRQAAGGSGPVEPTEDLAHLCRALRDDVRRPISELAAEVRRTPAWVSRGIARLLRADWVSWRVDCSHYAAGSQVVTTTWLEVPANDLDKLGYWIASRQPSVRLCCAIVGRANLFVMQWHRSFDRLDLLEQTVQAAFPEVRVLSRALVVRIAKRVGQILDGDGRSTGFVPVHPQQSIV